MQSKMDCNNNDGTNYVYQMQQTMNNVVNERINDAMGANGNNMQQQQSIAYDKKPQFDLATSNNSVYLNGHSATPPINSLSNNMSTSNIPSNNNIQAGNLPPNNIHPTGGQFNTQSPIASPRTTNTPNRLNQYSDYTFNGSSNYYSNFERNLHYNQANQHLNQTNHHPSISQVQNKESRQIQMPYHEANSMYNHSQSNHLADNHLPVHQQSQVHHPNQQIPSQHHQNLRPHHIPQQQLMNSHNAYSQQTTYPVQQQHVVNTYNNSPAANSNFSNANTSNAPASVYNVNNTNYYSGYNGDQWRYQLSSGSPPQRIINQQQPPNSQVQMNSMSSSGPNQQTHVKIDNAMTNLNNSTNLSQPYSNLHISNNAMNNSMNSSMNSIPMTNSPTINQQQLQPNSFNSNQANNSNYMPMNSYSSYSTYQPPIDNHQMQQNHYLASPPPPPQNHQTNMQQYHLNKNTNNRLQTLQPLSHNPPNQNSQQSNQTGNNQQTKNYLSALDETLDSVVNGTIELPLTVKPTRRRRGKGKTTKEKGKKETKSAYALFFKQTQEELKRLNPKMNFGDISKTVANRWSLLSDEHKQGYKSITDKERKVKLEELAKEKAMKVSGVMETRSELDDNSLLTD